MKVVEQFKRRILDLAIRGKLVPQDPNDEPASVLLERIKAEKAKLVKAGKIKKEKNPSEIVIGSDGAAYEKLTSTPPFKIPKNWLWVQIDSISESINVGWEKLPKYNWGKCSIKRILWATCTRILRMSLFVGALSILAI